MRLDEYTPDAICRAMGLPACADDPGSRGGDRAVRLLLMPSFDPEVCVTIVPRAELALLDVRAFASLLWHMPTPATPPPVFAERVAIGRDILDEATRDLESAIRNDAAASRRSVTIDGMPAVVVLWSPSGSQRAEANVGSSPPLRKLVARVLRDVHARLPVGHCRNAVARAGRYVELTLSVDALPDPPASPRIGVFGDEGGRKEVIERLARHNEGGRPAANL